MFDLSRQQKRDLYEFVQHDRCQDRPLNRGLEKTLGYIMSNMDVRKNELLEDEYSRELVWCAFQVLKNEYLFENGSISAAGYKEAIGRIRARAKQYYPGRKISARSPAQVSPI